MWKPIWKDINILKLKEIFLINKHKMSIKLIWFTLSLIILDYKIILQCIFNFFQCKGSFEIERDFFNKLGVLIDGDFKFGVLLLVFVRFLGGDTGNLYRNGFKLTLLKTKLINTLIKIICSLSTFRRCQDSRERGKGDWHW
jgi:hypothetical protein